MKVINLVLVLALTMLFTACNSGSAGGGGGVSESAGPVVVSKPEAAPASHPTAVELTTLDLQKMYDDLVPIWKDKNEFSRSVALGYYSEEKQVKWNDVQLDLIFGSFNTGFGEDLDPDFKQLAEEIIKL